MTIHDELQKLSEQLRQQRDELKVQVHLAKEDLKDEWADLEQRWDQFRGKVGQAGQDAEDVKQDIAQAASDLGQEIRKGYDRIKSRF